MEVKSNKNEIKVQKNKYFIDELYNKKITN